MPPANATRRRQSRPAPPAAPAVTWDVVVDSAAPPGDVLRPLAALLLARARRRLAEERAEREGEGVRP